MLCAAVGLDAVACVMPTEDGIVSIHSEGYPDPIRVELSSLESVQAERGSTAALVRGVAKGLTDFVADSWRRPQGPPRLHGKISSSVLPGSGLSSSAAFEVLLGTIMADLAGIDVPPVEIARIGQFAENEYFGKPCGLMDQTASAVGGIVAIDFADPSAPVVKRIDYDFAEKGYELVVVNTGGSHADLTADYAAVPAEMKAVASLLGARYLREIDPELLIARGPEIRKACGDRALLRALHFVAENARVVDMAEALEAGRPRRLPQAREGIRALLMGAPAEPLPLLIAEGAGPPRRPRPHRGATSAARAPGACTAAASRARSRPTCPASAHARLCRLMERYFGPASVIPVSVRVAGRLAGPRMSLPAKARSSDGRGQERLRSAISGAPSLISLGFFTMGLMDPLYDNFVPLFLKDYVGSMSLRNSIMTIDNVFALFLIPIVSAWSDGARTRIGRRMPLHPRDPALERDPVLRPALRRRRLLRGPDRCSSSRSTSSSRAPAGRSWPSCPTSFPASTAPRPTASSTWPEPPPDIIASRGPRPAHESRHHATLPRRHEGQAALHPGGHSSSSPASYSLFLFVKERDRDESSPKDEAEERSPILASLRAIAGAEDKSALLILLSHLPLVLRLPGRPALPRAPICST